MKKYYFDVEILDPAQYTPSFNCHLCGSNPTSPKSLQPCHFCGKYFCKSHLLKSRPDPNGHILHPICSSCDKAYICKGIYEEFSNEKTNIELEINRIKAEEKALDEQILIKTQVIENIKKNKDIVLDGLTSETLALSQTIEDVNQRNKALEKEILKKNIEKVALDKELDTIDLLIKELNEENEGPTGYDYIWKDGLMGPKDERKKGNIADGICHCWGRC